jgi:hypothetical protein
MHLHDPTPLRCSHSAFGPQGEGWHGFNTSGFAIYGTHCTKAFPLKPAGQVHETVFAITLHSAFDPQTLGQGFEHLLLMQDLSLGQSAFTTHSGRQLGAFPKYPEIH